MYGVRSMSLDTSTQVPRSFQDLLGRADDETLQLLVEPHAVRLLSALDPHLATPSNLRMICMQLHSPTELLREPTARTCLLQLLRPEDARELADVLQIDNTEPYTSLAQASIRRNSTMEKRLLTYFRIIEPEPHDPEVSSAVDRVRASYSLFDYQRRAQRDVLEILESSEPRLVLHMPTGAGKTRTAMHAVAEKLRSSAGSVIVWLAYSEELCEQAMQEFETAWTHLGDRQVDIYRFWGNRSVDIQDVHDGFMVASLAKTYQRAKRDGDFISRLADRASLVIIDEAHQAIATTYSFLLNYLVERTPSTGLLGLTATPGRTWNDPEADRALSDFFHRQKVTLQIPGFDNPVDYLISQGYLSNLTFRPLPFSTEATLTDVQMRELSMSLDVPESILRQLAEDDQRNMIVVDAAEDLLSRHSRVLFFAATVDHAKLIAIVLQARGIDAVAITSTTPRDVRNRAITRYRSQNHSAMVLCSYGVLTTGFDAPQTSAALIARPTKSLVLYSQMVGRAIRGPLAGGTAMAEVVSVVDTHLPGFRELSETFTNWEDVWNELPTV